jgi:hypothetical protein
MPDPEVQTPPDFQFYVQQHGVRTPREFLRGSRLGMQKSLTKAHDNLSKQVGINTRLYHDLTEAQRALRRERRWRRFLATTVSVEFTLLLWLLHEFLSRI